MNFTITTPLYYVNDKPHLGSTYTTLASDSIARFHRLMNNNVIFITGVDEHGQKIQRKANSMNIPPQEHCDIISKEYIELWKKWGISNDKFIRTTSEEHKKLVYEFYKRVSDNGDIRLGRQKGWYCVGCEEFKDVDEDKDEPKCQIHNQNLEWRDEENLFFCLSNYQRKIEDLVNSEDFIQPLSRRNEIVNFVKNGLKDFSISRVNLDWGIPVPGHNKHTFYVWFDALLGYLSAISECGSNKIDLVTQSGWPASVHIIGKDILRFHAVYWPAMLLSAKLPLPRNVFGHGFLTREGQKMGKSLGNVIDPEYFLDLYGQDAIRWYLLRDIEFGNDGDFQSKRFIDIVNNDLNNTIGNLLNRTISMSSKWFNDKTPTCNPTNDIVLIDVCSKSVESYKKYFVSYKLKQSCEEIIMLASYANNYLNENEPWKLIKDDSKNNKVSEIIYNVLEICRIIGFLLQPITPNLSNKILSQLSLKNNVNNWEDILKWGNLKTNTQLPEPKPVMNRIEYS